MGGSLAGNAEIQEILAEDIFGRYQEANPAEEHDQDAGDEEGEGVLGLRERCCVMIT